MIAHVVVSSLKMSRRRRRCKRKPPQRIDCDNPAKRQEFFLNIHGSSVETRVVSETDNPDDLAQSQSHHFDPGLPPPCLAENAKDISAIPLHSKHSANLFKPALCIGKISIALSSTDVGYLLATINNPTSNTTSVSLANSSGQFYIQLCTNTGKVDVLSVAASKPLWDIYHLGLPHTSRKVPRCCVCFLICGPMVEEKHVSRKCEAEDEASVLNEGEGVRVDDGVRVEKEPSGGTPANVVVEGEGCGEGVDGGKDEGGVRMSGGRYRYVEVEVWVGGCVCETREPSELPDSGLLYFSVYLDKLVNILHPSDEAARNLLPKGWF